MLPWQRLSINFSHVSLTSSEGEPGGMGRTGTISDLLTRTPEPEQDLLLDSGPSASPRVCLLGTLFSGFLFYFIWENLFLYQVANGFRFSSCAVDSGTDR